MRFIVIKNLAKQYEIVDTQNGINKSVQSFETRSAANKDATTRNQKAERRSQTKSTIAAPVVNNSYSY